MEPQQTNLCASTNASDHSSSPLEFEACYKYCEALASSRRHNVPVASFFVPQRLRKHIFAIYAFARTADDIADEAQYAGRRSRELDSWETQLEACFHGEPAKSPIFVALAHTIAEFDLPITPFQCLLSGYRTDIETARYATYQDLRNYTALSAAPIGDLFLYLGGYRDTALLRCAEELASAVATATLWQHVTEDLQRGRIYIPQEDLRHFGVGESALYAKTTAKNFGALIRFECARTRSTLERARPIVDTIGDDLAVEMALIWHGAWRILYKIETVGRKLLHVRPLLSPADKARVVSKALAWRGGSLTRRAARRIRVSAAK